MIHCFLVVIGNLCMVYVMIFLHIQYCNTLNSIHVFDFVCRKYAPASNWTYKCPRSCAAFAASAPIYGCSTQNVYDISSSVCVAALHQVRIDL